METLGLPIHVTELDINSAQGGQRSTGADIANNADTTKGGLVDDANKRLADAYAGIFRAFLKHKGNVKLVTFWGVNDAVSWHRRAPAVVRRQQPAETRVRCRDCRGKERGGG